MSHRRNLADALPPALDEARLSRQWSAIEQAGLPNSPRHGGLRRAVPWAVAALALCAAAVAFLGGVPTPLPQGALLASANEPITVSLRDGSRVDVKPLSRVRLTTSSPERMALVLEQGGARFEVTKRAKRRFVVNVAGVQVRVVGTRFSVGRHPEGSGERVLVQVEEGIVEVVAGPGEPPRRLLAGERWSIVVAGAAPRGGLPESVAPAPPPQIPDLPTPLEPVAEARNEGRDPPAQLPHRQPRAKRRGLAASDAPAAQEDATAIFRQARLARRGGRMGDAAQAYQRLLERFPEDGRAGLAAFELGRIRMDTLGDVRGAISALNQALSAPGTASVREDALARLVLAYDAAGRMGACRKALSRYVSRYPDGVHGASLSARCADE